MAAKSMPYTGTDLALVLQLELIDWLSNPTIQMQHGTHQPEGRLVLTTTTFLELLL